MKDSIRSTDRFLREPEVREITGLSRPTRWRLERAGKFPSRRQIAPNAVAWLESEIQAWTGERAACGTIEPEPAAP